MMCWIVVKVYTRLKAIQYIMHSPAFTSVKSQRLTYHLFDKHTDQAAIFDMREKDVFYL